MTVSITIYPSGDELGAALADSPEDAADALLALIQGVESTELQDAIERLVRADPDRVEKLFERLREDIWQGILQAVEGE